MSVVEVSREYGGRLLKLQTGKLAKQADASVLATYGETMVLVAVVSARKLGASQDFFPLTVDFHEKYYAAGRIPGGFFKREAKPSDKATLSARLIDRPIRPLFPEDYLFETNVTVTVLSIDGVNDPDYVASIAASAAIHMSDIPFNGPVGSCRVGMLDGKYVINFPPSEVENSKLDFLVSGIPSGVVMVEGSAKECSEKEMIDAIDHAHKEMRVIFEMQEELREKAGKPKRKYEAPPKDEALKEEIKKFSWGGFEKGFAIREKLARYEALDGVKKAVKEKFEVKEPKTDADKVRNKLVGVYLEELKATYARELTVNTKKRIDGRTYSDIRPITCEASLLPRVHGSALFTRGETQVLAAITLGTSDDEQKIDSISGTYQKRFMLHYNFPPFSVGEARPNRPPGRREIGHGFLAERALTAVLPDPEKFPYTIRLVSEVLESNGSSSMATVCSGSLAMMDAGIPTAKPVAGVAMGLIKEGEKIAVLSDILGDEDHLGDMDFKVCGTHDGITAFQMDLKIGGVSREIMEQALEQAREGRVHILGKMAELMDKPRENFSPYAPRIFTIKVKPDKVREVIGSGGKVIRSIIERTGVKIDIEDDGRIHIASTDEAAANKAIEIINEICAEAEPGKIYEGPVTKIMDFGAFIEIFPGTEGLCHISELEHFRVRYVDDVVKVGDTVKVKCLEVDPSGKIRLSRKALIEKTDAPPPEGGGDEGGGGGRGPRDDRPPRDDRGGDRDRGPRGGGGGRFGGGGDRGGRGGSSGGGRDRDRGPRGGGGGRSMGGGGFGGDRDRGPDRGPAPVRERDRDRGPGPGPDRGERPGNRMPRRDEAPRSLDRDDRPPREDFRDREDRGYFPKDDREPRAETSRDDDDRFNRRDDE